ncbi:hypothetical protein WAF17_08995 [Bernardetia sp. ABR2-2B]|uniref:hypothetical protein n=1 Tax=Bernardetia sp. ABR2-2B TaxID=3127472 RepID=UPI0030CF4675
MKQFFTYTFYAKKIVRFLLFFLVLLVAMPIIETPKVEAQTTKTGNFFTRRFKRKNKFRRKSKNSTAFQRKPFSCDEIGKTKVKQIKVSKKQLRRWEEERMVKAEQQRLKEERQAKNNAKTQEEDVVLSASSKNDIEEIANSKSNTEKTETKVEKEEDKTEVVGWYSSEKPTTPRISPIKIGQKNEIAIQKNKEELEIAAKYSRLGHTIFLESTSEKQLEVVKNYLLSIGAEEEAIKTKKSQRANGDEVNIKIEK